MLPPRCPNLSSVVYLMTLPGHAGPNLTLVFYKSMLVQKLWKIEFGCCKIGWVFSLSLQDYFYLKPKFGYKFFVPLLKQLFIKLIYSLPSFFEFEVTSVQLGQKKGAKQTNDLTLFWMERKFNVYCFFIQGLLTFIFCTCCIFIALGFFLPVYFRCKPFCLDQRPYILYHGRGSHSNL